MYEVKPALPGVKSVKSKTNVSINIKLYSMHYSEIYMYSIFVTIQ